MELGGTKVEVNGQAAPVLSVSATKVEFVCPMLPLGTPLEVSVETPSGTSSPISMRMESASPHIFELDDSADSQGLVSFEGSSELTMPRNSEIPGHPAQPFDEVILWGTGFGPTAEANPTLISATIGNVNAEVEAVQGVPGHAGLYTVRMRVPVPAIFGNNVPLQLQVVGSDGRVFSSNTVTIAIEPAK